VKTQDWKWLTTQREGQFFERKSCYDCSGKQPKRRLEDYLSEKFGTKVDLVTEDALKPLIKPYVMETIAYV